MSSSDVGVTTIGTPIRIETYSRAGTLSSSHRHRLDPRRTISHRVLDDRGPQHMAGSREVAPGTAQLTHYFAAETVDLRDTLSRARDSGGLMRALELAPTRSCRGSALRRGDEKDNDFGTHDKAAEICGQQAPCE
jgi:hypothetical protein